MPIVLMVYALIVIFASWYMDGETGNRMFFGILGVFIFGIMIFLVRKFIGLVTGWERIGLISFLLIGF